MSAVRAEKEAVARYAACERYDTLGDYQGVRSGSKPNENSGQHRWNVCYYVTKEQKLCRLYFKKLQKATDDQSFGIYDRGNVESYYTGQSHYAREHQGKP